MPGWASLVYSGGKIGQLEFNLVIPQETVIELAVACRDQEKLSLIYRREGGDGAVKQAIGILNTHPLPHPLTDSWGMRESLQGFFDAIHMGGSPRANVDVMHRIQHARTALRGC